MHCTTTSTPTLPLPADISDIPRLALKAMPPRSPRTRTPERRRDGGSVGAGGGVGAGGPAGQSVYAIGPCGRWVWKTHRRCTDGVVPWDVQALNTEPTMLHWKSGAEYVTAVRPGLYEVRFAIWLRATVGASVRSCGVQISLGFFCSEPLEVDVLVNGDPILTAP